MHTHYITGFNCLCLLGQVKLQILFSIQGAVMVPLCWVLCLLSSWDWDTRNSVRTCARSVRASNQPGAVGLGEWPLGLQLCSGTAHRLDCRRTVMLQGWLCCQSILSCVSQENCMQSSGLSCVVFYPKTHLLLKRRLKGSNMYVGRTLFLVGEKFFIPCMQFLERECTVT